MDARFTIAEPCRLDLPLSASAGRAQLRAEPDARHVDRDEAAPILDGGVHQILAEKNAGVVHKNVELTELLGCCSDSSRPRRLRGHIKGESQRVAALAGDFLCGFAHAIGQNVAEHD